MSENEIIEIAKATREVAKTGGKAIDATSAFGRFCDRVFGEGITDGFGFVADRVKYARIKQAIRLQEKVDELHKDAGVIEFRPVSPVIALPVFETATLEEDDGLHSAWAKLLSTAMDPSKQDVKRSFVGILRELDPFDVTLFELIMGTSAAHKHDRSIRFSKQKIEHWLAGNLSEVDEIWSNTPGSSSFVIRDGVDEAEVADQARDIDAGSGSVSQVEVSLLNLVRLGLLVFAHIENAGMNFGGHTLSIFRGLEEVSVSGLGIEFYQAVSG